MALRRLVGISFLSHSNATHKNPRYIIQLKGRPYVLLIINDGGGELYLPDAPNPRRVRC
ncbi:Hypothetical Protein PD5205_01364 [Xanthomonas fragariae]|uniref:Uncharacterized protein n=1 Tax=Xanthomonas fragariae TaxID=48664 RepID=A0A1Y6GUN0_9XANT|nr:Hypothetical Protein NBC2815_01399 [Xanthomonas fragariae]SMQ99872.1 hypothetical protein PD885_02642 [Xanthomonas fragariae]SMR02675.1 Hypothetical Protein PD5205_01364 [Xanthomonas fragariae]